MAEATLLGQNSGSSGSSNNESIYERPVSFDFEDVPYKRNITIINSSFTFNSSSYTKIASFTYSSSETINNQNNNLYFYINGTFSAKSDGGENVKLYYKATTSSSYTQILSHHYSDWNNAPIFSITKSSLKNGTTYEFFVQSTCSEYGCDITLTLQNIEYWYGITQIAITNSFGSSYTNTTFNGEGYYKFYCQSLYPLNSSSYSASIGQKKVNYVPNDTIIYIPAGTQELSYDMSGLSKAAGYIYIYKVNKKNNKITEKVIKNSIKKKHYISHSFTSNEFISFDHYIDIDKIINPINCTLFCPSGIVVSSVSSPVEFLELN